MSIDDEKNFKLSNKCCICYKLYAEKNNKARDRDHVTGKNRGSAHKDYNVNFRLIK